MTILNLNDFKSIKTFRCGRYVATYILNNGIPLLSLDKEKEIYTFSNTERLQRCFDNAPFRIRFMIFLEKWFDFDA